MDADIAKFLSSKAFGVVGASNNRSKYGNKVLRCYLQHELKAYPINPREKIVEGIPSVGVISDLPKEVESLSIITPPSITEKIVEQAIAHGIKHIWMQPGAESDEGIRNARAHNLTVIAHGPCVLVQLGFRDKD
jgi:uncharacterized protein